MSDELEAPAYAMSVIPGEIIRQRSLGWPDFHPETFCHLCGRRNINWWTHGPEWLEATSDLPRKELEILCPVCFVNEHERVTGHRFAWHMERDQ